MIRMPLQRLERAAWALIAMSQQGLLRPPMTAKQEDEHRDGVPSPGSHSTAPKKMRKIGTSRAPNTSASRPATSIAAGRQRDTQQRKPDCASLAP